MRWVEPLISFLGLRALAVTAAAFALIGLPPAHAATLRFAGVSFLGEHSDIATRLAHVDAIVGFSQRSQAFNRMLAARLAQTAIAGETIAYGDALARDGDARVLSFAFSGESVEVQQFEGKYLAIYSLAAQVLVFDYASEKKSLVASWPVRVRFSAVVPSVPTPEEERKAFERMIMDPGAKANIVNEWLATLPRVTLKTGGRLVRIATVGAEEKAQSALANAPGADPDATLREIGQFFEGAVSTALRLPMIPYTQGVAVGNTMRAVFADGFALDMDLPKPDFVLAVTLREFRKVKEEVPGAEVVGFGAFVHLKITGEAMDPPSVIVDARLRHSATVTVPTHSGIDIKDWPQFQQVLSGLLEDIARHVAAPDDGWVAARSSTPGAAAQMRAAHDRLRPSTKDL